MDFHSMKRKELQALCKKHKIPANLTNLEMANNLASLLKEKEKHMIRGQSCLKNLSEVVDESDSNRVTRPSKKVRFSPENEMIEFVRSRADYVETKRGAGRRKSLIMRTTFKGGLVIDNIEADRDIEENPVRKTRSRAQKSSSGGLISVVLPLSENDRIEFVDSKADYAETKRGSWRRKSIMKPLAKKGGVVSDSVDNVEATRSIVENPVRHTRSRAQKSQSGGAIEVVLPMAEKKRKRRNGVGSDSVEGNDGGRGDEPSLIVDLSDNLASECVDVEEVGVTTRRSLRNRAVLISKKSGEFEKDVAVLRKDQTNSKKKQVEANAEISKGNGFEAGGGIVQPEKALRRSTRNLRTAEDYRLMNKGLVDNEMAIGGKTTPSQTHLAGNGSALEGETDVEVHGKLEVVLQLEEPFRHRGRNSIRNESVPISDGMDRNAKKTGKSKPQKRRGDLNVEETIVTEGAAIFEEPPPRRSRRNATKTVINALRSKKLRSRTKISNSEVKPSAERTFAIGEPPILDAQVYKPEIAESAINTVLNKQKTTSNCSSTNRKELSEESLSKEVSVEASYIEEEAKALEMENSVEIGASENVKLQNNQAETEILFSVSGSEVDLASHSCKRSREFDSNIIVEPETELEEDLSVPIDDGYLVVDLTDYMATPTLGNLDIGKETERDEEAASPNDSDSVVKEQNLEELKDSDNVCEPIKPEFVVENRSGESNESEEPSVADLSDKEGISPAKVQDRETDGADKSGMGTEEQESRTENIEMVTLLTKNISAFIGPPVTDTGSSELEVADGTSNPALSSSEKVSDHTNKGNWYDLASPSWIQSGSFEDQDGVSIAVFTGATFRAPGFSPFHQGEHVAQPPSSILTLSGHLEVVEPVSSKQEGVREGHSTGPNESESVGEECENTFENDVDIRALDHSHGERLTPNMVEQNDIEAEFRVGAGSLQEPISISDEVTAKVVSEETRDFENTSGCFSRGKPLTPLDSAECQGSPIGDQVRHFTGPALIIAANNAHEGHASLVEVEEKSKHDNEFHHGRMSDSDTSTNNTEDKICSPEKIEEVLAKMESKPEGLVSVEKPLLDGVDDDKVSVVKEQNLVEIEDGDYVGKPIKPKFVVEDHLAESNESEEPSVVDISDRERISPAKVQDRQKDEADKYDLASPSHIQYGDCEDQDNVSNVVFIGTTYRPVGLSPFHQGGHVAKPSSILTMSEHLEAVKPVSSTQEMDCQGHSTGPDESESLGEDCENTSVNAVDIRMLRTSRGESVTSNMVEKDENEADFSVGGGSLQENISLSIAEIAKVVLEEIADFQNTSGCCSMAFSTSAKEMSVSALRLSGDDEMQDEGTRCSPDDIANVPVIQSPIVTVDQEIGKSIEGDVHFDCSKLATEEENVEYFPEVDWDSSGWKDLVAEVNGKSDVFLDETPCKESEVSEEKIASELIKSTSKCMEGTNLPKRRENERTLAPCGQLGIRKMVLDHGVEFAIRDVKGFDASDMLSDKDEKEIVVLAATEAEFDHQESDTVLTDFDHKESEVVLMEHMNGVMLEHDEMNHKDPNIDKDEVVGDHGKSTYTALEKLTDRKEDEDLIEVSNKLEGAVSQGDGVESNNSANNKMQRNHELNKGSFVSPQEFVSADYEHGEDGASADVAPTKEQVEEGMKLDSIDSHTDGAILEGSLHIIEDNTYAEEHVAPGYFDPCLEHEKVLKQASCSQLHVSDSDRKYSESSLHQGDLSPDAEGRGVTEVDRVHPFDDCGYTVSSLVSFYCKEGRGNTTTYMDKYFLEDKVEGNVKSEQTKEQLVCNENAVASYHGTMGASEFSLESAMFSGWEINLFLGDEVINSASEISETQLTRADSNSLKGNANVIVPEEQFGEHNQLMDGKVAEPNISFLVSDEPMFEGDEVLEEKYLVNKTSEWSYSENEFYKVEKSSIPIDDVILTVSNSKGNELAASADPRVEGGFKSPEEENALKSVSMMEDQSSKSTDLAVDGGNNAEDTQIEEPKPELIKGNGAVKLLNSTTMKRKNAENSWIQRTPKKLIATLDMKENAPSVKREDFGSTTVRSTMKRRALGDLQNQ